MENGIPKRLRFLNFFFFLHRDISCKSNFFAKQKMSDERFILDSSPLASPLFDESKNVVGDSIVIVSSNEVLYRIGNCLRLERISLEESIEPQSLDLKLPYQSSDENEAHNGIPAGCVAYNNKRDLVAFVQYKGHSPIICVQTINRKDCGLSSHNLVIDEGAQFSYKLLSFNANGKRLSAVGNVIRTENGMPIVELDSKIWIWSLCYSNDGDGSKCLEGNLLYSIEIDLNEKVRNCVFSPFDDDYFLFFYESSSKCTLVYAEYIGLHQSHSVNTATFDIKCSKENDNSDPQSNSTTHNEILVTCASWSILNGLFVVGDSTGTLHIVSYNFEDIHLRLSEKCVLSLSDGHSPSAITSILYSNTNAVFGFKNGLVKCFDVSKLHNQNILIANRVIKTEGKVADVFLDETNLIVLHCDGRFSKIVVDPTDEHMEKVACATTELCFRDQLSVNVQTLLPCNERVASDIFIVGSSLGSLKACVLSPSSKRELICMSTMSVSYPITSLHTLDDIPIVVVGTADGTLRLIFVEWTKESDYGIIMTQLWCERIFPTKIDILDYDVKNRRLAIGSEGSHIIAILNLEEMKDENRASRCCDIVALSEGRQIVSFEWSDSKAEEKSTLLATTKNAEIINLIFEERKDSENPFMRLHHRIEVFSGCSEHDKNSNNEILVANGFMELYITGGNNTSVRVLSKSEDAKSSFAYQHGYKLHHNSISCFYVCDRARLIVAGTCCGDIIVFNIRRDRVSIIERKQVISVHSSKVTSISSSFDGTYLLSYSCDGVVFIHRLNNSNVRQPLINDGANSMIIVSAIFCPHDKSMFVSDLTLTCFRAKNPRVK